MGTDAEVSEGKPIMDPLVYHADGRTVATSNGCARLRREMLAALKDKGLLDPTKEAFTLIGSDHGALSMFYEIKGELSGRTFRAEAPTHLGEVEMKVYEVSEYGGELLR